MGGLRKQIGTLAFTLSLARALPLCAETPAETLHMFATCTGRLSALMEFQWLMQDPGADATMALRDQMLSLAEAAAQSADGPVQAMNWRVQAKAAQAALLSQAAFALDTRRAHQARIRAQSLTDECLSLLLLDARA
jgi:hypothetical protein